MKRQLDLRAGRVLVALGTLGIGGTYGASPAVSAQARAGGATGGTSAGAVGATTGGSAGGRAAQTSDGPPDPRGAVVFTDSIGEAASAVRPDRPLVVRPVLSATEPTRNLLVGGSVSVDGAVSPVTPTDRTVALQERRDGRWLTVARARTAARGRYHVGFRPPAPGTFSLRVRVDGPGNEAQPRRTLGPVNVYRRAFASWYGGGGSLACGGTLTDATLGVASKTLPCGTMVLFRVGHRTVRLPVVDRGPYVAGREFDLTAAAKRALGFGDLGMVWATA